MASHAIISLTMSTMRRLSLIISGILLRLCLFFGFTFFAMVILFGDSQTIKQILDENKAYSRSVTAVIESGKQKSLKNPDDIPFDDPEIQRIVRSSFSEQSLKSDAENIIDSVYDWLAGKTSRPDFQVDLADNKQQLASGLADYAVARVKSLPQCTDVPDVANIYRINCQPPYLDLKVQRELVFSLVMNDQSFIKDTTVDFDDLTKAEPDNGMAYAEGPQYFKWFKLAPLMLLGTALILGAFIILQNRTRRQGLKQVSSVFISTGVALIIAPLFASFITPSINKSIQNSLSGVSNPLAVVVSDITNSIYGELNKLLITIAIILIISGILARVALKLTRSKTPYKGVKSKTGLSSSVGNYPKGKIIKGNEVPVQTSERKAKLRKPGSIKSKNHKI